MSESYDWTETLRAAFPSGPYADFTITEHGGAKFIKAVRVKDGRSMSWQVTADLDAMMDYIREDARVDA